MKLKLVDLVRVVMDGGCDFVRIGLQGSEVGLDEFESDAEVGQLEGVICLQTVQQSSDETEHLGLFEDELVVQQQLFGSLSQKEHAAAL